MSGSISQMKARVLDAAALAGLRCRRRCVELLLPRFMIELPDGGEMVGPLALRASPLEAAALAVEIEAAIGQQLMEEARRLRDHGAPGEDTIVLHRLVEALRQMDAAPPAKPTAMQDAA